MSNLITPTIFAFIGFVIAVLTSGDDGPLIFFPVLGVAVWYLGKTMFPQLGNFLLKRDAARRGDYEPRD